jgi:putative FmdB family regulatory protein
MPRYSYTCTECKNTIEAFHSSDERLSFCDSCQTDTLKKNLNMPNIVKNNLTNNGNGITLKEKLSELKEELKDYKTQLKKEAM